jgi:two-component system phosphate regulon sensor histidine kinase PhoR
MLTWLLVSVVLVAAVAAVVLLKRHRVRWERLELIVRDLADGKVPATFLFLGSRRFARLSADLERLSREQEKLRAQLNERGFDLQTILSSMVEGVVVVDEKQVIRSVNASLCGLFEVTGDPVGQTVLAAFRDVAVAEILRETFKTGEAVSRDLCPVAFPGRRFTASAVPIRDAAGKVGGAAVIFHDITRLRQLEEMRREFVANISHELRTPLSIFQGYVETLLHDPAIPRKDLVASLQVMRKHSNRLNALTEDLLTLARLESRTYKLQLAPIRLDALLDNAASDWRSVAAKNGISIVLEAGKAMPEVVADEVRMEQVLNNLLDNALKYTARGGAITLSASVSGDVAELRCADTGVGIPPADLPRIFERFYRVEKARSRETGGTGLGLSIVKHILTLHGGSVDVQSEFGKGTTFIVRLPCGRKGLNLSSPEARDPKD